MAAENYAKMFHLGEGSFGEVFKAKDTRKLPHEENYFVAIKRIFLDGYHADLDDINELNILQELQAMDNPNIVKLLEPAYVDDDYLCLVFEFCDYPLDVEIDQNPPDTDGVKKFLKQMLNGVKTFHDLGIVHRDLKPKNILVQRGDDDDDDDDTTLKIADFGLARQQFIKGKPLTPRVGTSGYQAPEILLGSREYDLKVDIWSLGCIFYELLKPGHGKLIDGGGKSGDLGKIFTMFGRPNDDEWPGVSQMESYLNAPVGVTTGLPIDDDDDVDADARDLLEEMLALNPANRISAGEALMHPFLR